MDRLIIESRNIISKVSTNFLRYKYQQINWSSRLFAILGPMGVGKTTMVLQHAKLHLPLDKTLYVSADNIWFSLHTITDLVEQLNLMGYRHLIIDEIHKYTEWSRELKHAYDFYPDLQIIFTGSSVLDILRGSADLSRRTIMHLMQGLSFREYLQLFEGIAAPQVTLQDILHHQVKIDGLEHPIPSFRNYLKRGYYPFGMDDEYEQRLVQLVEQTLQVDIPQYASMNVSTGKKLQQLLMIIAQSVPFKPSMQKLAEMIDVSRNYLRDYMLYMERAGMIAQLQDSTAGVRGLGKVEKVYLDNTNLSYVLSRTAPDIGNLRETFFYNQLRVIGDVYADKKADFVFENYTFEIGGRSKQQMQLEQAKNGIIVKDDIEIGYLNVVPLWTFGLLY